MLLGIYPNKLKTYVHTKTCTHRFMAALCRIVKTWKQASCPSIGEWINKLWYIHAMEYYSAIKRNELSWKDMEKHSLHITTWKKPILRCYILSDSSCIVTERCRVRLFGAQKPVNRQCWWQVCFAPDAGSWGGRADVCPKADCPPPTSRG